MNLRGVLCLAAFIVAYSCLIPGLTCLLFSAKAAPMGFTVLDIQKSTLGAVHMLFDKGRYVAASVILVCSVIAPFVKLAVLLVCSCYMWGQDNVGPAVVTAIKAVRRISKWATVDAFTAAILYAFFCQNSVLKVELHKGFYFFMGYCIFSIAGALLLEIPAQQLPHEQQRLVQTATIKQNLPTVVGCSVAMICLLIGLACVPIFSVECSLLFLKDKLSFMALMRNLVSAQGSPIAFLTLFLFGAVAPAADFIYAITQGIVGRIDHPAAEWVQDFAMLDVFALACVVVANAASGMSGALKVSVLPAGWILCTLASFWVIYCLTLRTSTNAQAPKDRPVEYSPEAAIGKAC